ncbi:MAG TPA: MFS transporter [Candidatus Limnocylindria bacterium]|nr:MFS transporter [Candidatus Limnocylindria bacterium]
MSDSRSLLRLLPAVFAIQAGFHGFTGALPVALAAAAYSNGQIGLIVGTAFTVQMFAAPVIGALIDRAGPYRLLLVGVAAYLLATLLLGISELDPSEPILGLFTARVLQGIGFAVVVPAVLTLVPLVVDAAQRGFWLSVVLLAQNLTLAVLPAASLFILEVSSFRGVAVSAALVILLGALLANRLPRPTLASGRAGSSSMVIASPARRQWGLAFRRAWAVPLAITLFAVAYWGVVLTYLPPRAELAGTSSAFFFIGYGASVLISRIPTGWLADRHEARLLVGAGLLVSVGSIALLLLTPTVATLVGGGLLAGLSAGLILSPMLLELTVRSSTADRGSAFALFSVISGGANALGAIGGAPIVERFGFEAALIVGLGGVAIAGMLTLADPSLRRSHLRVPPTVPL